MSDAYGAARRGRGAADARPRARAGRHLLGHGRRLRPRGERAPARPGPRRAARAGRAGDQVRQRARRRRPVRRGGRPPRVRPRRVRGVARRASASSTIDLYYLHRVDPAVPIEETVGAMAELVAEGLVAPPRPERGRAADASAARHAVHPIAAVQSEYSLWHRDARGEVLADAAASSGSASCPSARSAAASWRARSPRRTTWTTSDLRRALAALPGREPRPQPRAGRARARARGRAGRDAGPARPRLGARPGRRRRPDPRHQAPRLPRAERRGRGAGARRGRPRRARRGPRRRGAAAGERYPEFLERLIDKG